MSNTNDATIEVDDDAVVSIDIADDPALAGAAAATEADEGKPAPAAAPALAEAEDSATVALQQAIERERTAREAAEATARTERQRADEAARLAASRATELRSSQETAEARELELVSSSIENANRELEAAQADWKNAQEAGDFTAAAAANGKIAKAAAKIDRLETSKADLEAGKTRKPATEGRVEAQPQPTQASAFEQYVSHYAPSAQAWLRAHPECVPAEVGGDPLKNAKMMRGHYDALAQQLRPNSPEYFAVIEKAITDTPAAASAEVTPQPKPKPRTPAPSAPPSREAISANGTPQKRSVTLNREQQEIARMSFPDKQPKEAYALYARNLLELQAEGKLGRASH